MVEYQADRLTETYASLAHPVRRAILARLRDGDARVTELAHPFAISLAATSKHLSLLERAGLVERRVVGREHWISLVPEPLEAAAGWLGHYRTFWEARLDALAELMSEMPDG